MPKVIYLTGAPAAGKSSTLRMLLEKRPDIAAWEYGTKLTEYIQSRGRHSLQSQDQLRTESANVVTPEDVGAVDAQLLDFVLDNRESRHVKIDSHPVTKEAWGFRITAFSASDFARLAPDEIWLLYVSPELTRQRIARDAGGRPQITPEEAQLHTSLQASVAANYGIIVGKPVYLFDSSMDQAALTDALLRRLP